MKTIKTTFTTAKALLVVIVSAMTISACRPCMDALEEERIMGMSYHDNAVTVEKGWNLLMGNFTEGNSDPWTITGGDFTITDFHVTSGQDPNKNMKIGNHYTLNRSNQFVFVFGRKASENVAATFNVSCPPWHNTFNHEAGELNFWMKGTMVLKFKNGTTYTFPNTFFAQGHAGAYNNWWFGNDAMTNNSVGMTLFNPFKSSYVTYIAHEKAGCGYISPIEDPNIVFKFQRGSDIFFAAVENPSVITLIGMYKYHE